MTTDPIEGLGTMTGRGKRGVVGALIELTSRLATLPLNQALLLTRLWVEMMGMADGCVEALIQGPGPTIADVLERVCEEVQRDLEAYNRLKGLKLDAAGLEGRARLTLDLSVPYSPSGTRKPTGGQRRVSWKSQPHPHSGYSSKENGSEPVHEDEEALLLARWILLRETIQELIAGVQARRQAMSPPPRPFWKGLGLNGWWRPGAREVLEANPILHHHEGCRG